MGPYLSNHEPATCTLRARPPAVGLSLYDQAAAAEPGRLHGGAQPGQSGPQDHDVSHRLDLDRFEQKEAAARAALAAGELRQASQLLAQALEIGSGIALDGLGDWFKSDSGKLEERKHAVLVNRIDIDFWRGLYADLVPELTGLVWSRPDDDRFRVRLMIALHASGRTHESLALYEDGRQIAIELGQEVGSILRKVHQGVLKGATALSLLPNFASVQGRPFRGAGLGAAVVSHRYLPAKVSNFTGRSSELAKLDAAVAAAEADSTTAVVVVSGPAAIGKTALSVFWAHAVSSRFPDAQIYLDLQGYGSSPPLDSPTALGRLLEALGVPVGNMPKSETERVLKYQSILASKRALILLDNALSREQVRILLPGSPGCVVMITSRSSLGSLVAKEGARRVDVGPLQVSDAVELLGEIIGHTVVSAEPEAAVEVARLCDYFPLACASWPNARPARVCR